MLRALIAARRWLPATHALWATRSLVNEVRVQQSWTGGAEVRGLASTPQEYGCERFMSAASSATRHSRPSYRHGTISSQRVYTSRVKASSVRTTLVVTAA